MNWLMSYGVLDVGACHYVFFRQYIEFQDISLRKISHILNLAT